MAALSAVPGLVQQAAALLSSSTDVRTAQELQSVVEGCFLRVHLESLSEEPPREEAQHTDVSSSSTQHWAQLRLYARTLSQALRLGEVEPAAVRSCFYWGSFDVWVSATLTGAHGGGGQRVSK